MSAAIYADMVLEGVDVSTPPPVNTPKIQELARAWRDLALARGTVLGAVGAQDLETVRRRDRAARSARQAEKRLRAFGVSL